MVRLTVTIPDRPGALGRLSNLVGDLNANIIQIVHDRAFTHATSLGETDVELTLETRGPDHIQALTAALEEAGYTVTVAT